MISNDIRKEILSLRRSGLSTRKIAKEVGVSRSTVIKYIRQDQALREKLETTEEGTPEYEQIQAELENGPVHKAKGRKKNKWRYTPEVDAVVDEIMAGDLIDEDWGDDRTVSEIYKLVKRKGYKVSYSTIRSQVFKKRGEEE